tara:strand:+ start:23502 stop:24932 length:1431 start_codon:yes stop_codon:yes gene_type:complete
MDKNTPFHLFVLTVCIGLIAPLAVQDGMFMDGQIYAAVSHNLANGHGSFWFPTFSKFFMTDYSEQLPLFFGVQAIFFKILGDSIYTERIFSLIMALITGWNIVLIWRLIYHNESDSKNRTWLPLFFWIMIPVISWSYIHNVEEMLMSVFATASVYFILKGLITEKNLLPNIIIGGIFLFLTSFCKGFQGLFPLVTIVFYALFFKTISFKKALGYSVVLGLVPFIIYALLLWNDTSYLSIENYFNNRIVRTFTKSYSATTTNHFSLLNQIFEQLIPVFIILALSFAILKWKIKNSRLSIDWKRFGFFLSLGLAGSLPLMITLEQRGFYLTTSFPFTAIAFACMGENMLHPVLDRINPNGKGFRIFNAVSIIGLVGVIILTGLSIGKSKRNQDELHDVYLIGANVPENSNFSIPNSLKGNYGLQAYFIRHFYISLDPDTANLHTYFLTLKGSNTQIPAGFLPVELDFKTYQLYQRNEP